MFVQVGNVPRLGDALSSQESRLLMRQDILALLDRFRAWFRGAEEQAAPAGIVHDIDSAQPAAAQTPIPSTLPPAALPETSVQDPSLAKFPVGLTIAAAAALYFSLK